MPASSLPKGLEEKVSEIPGPGRFRVAVLMEVQAFAAGIVHAQGTGGVFEGQAGGHFVEAVPSDQIVFHDDIVDFFQEVFAHGLFNGISASFSHRKEEVAPITAYREGPARAAASVLLVEEEVRIKGDNLRGKDDLGGIVAVPPRHPAIHAVGSAGATASPEGEERAQRGGRKQKKGEEFLHGAS